MDRRTFLITSVGLLICGASSASAETVEGSVSRQLAAQGYAITKRKRTLLGRVKLEAVNHRRRREIVFDPTTGEVLRDYTEPGTREKPAASGRSDRRGASRNGSSGGSNGAGDEGEDEGNQKEEEDDSDREGRAEGDEPEDREPEESDDD